MKITHLVLSWSTSRGKDTYGYNICRLDDSNEGQRFKCLGGGYDMVGTVLAQWLCANYQDRLLAIKDQAYSTYSKEIGFKRCDPDSGAFYGMNYYPDDNRVYIDGACGLNCVLEIAAAIGLDMERDYITKGRRRGETIGWYVSDKE